MNHDDVAVFRLQAADRLDAAGLHDWSGASFAYRSMPQRQDPQIQVRSGVIQTLYPGANAIEVEQEVTRKIEKKMSENPAVEHVRSLSRQGLSVVFVDLFDTTKNAEAVWQDLDNKLASMTDLPSVGDQPIKPRLDKDFGDTVAVMLTFSSPPVSDFEVDRRASLIVRKLQDARAGRPGPFPRPPLQRRAGASFDRLTGFRRADGRSLLEQLTDAGLIADGQFIAMLGAGAVDFQLAAGCDEARIRSEVDRWKEDNLGAGLGHPDVWPGVLVKEPADLAGQLKRVCQQEPGGIARYSYEELRRFADLIQDRLRQSPRVGKIEQIGALDETIYLYYSNRRLGALGARARRARRPARLPQHQPAGRHGRAPSARTSSSSRAASFIAKAEIGDQVVDTRGGYPAYLRDLVEVVRGYEDPPRLLNFRTIKADPNIPPPRSPAETCPLRTRQRCARPTCRPSDVAEKPWTTRAITLAVRHVKGTHIADFSRDVDAALASLEGVLPDDLRIERTSNEPALVAPQDRPVRRLPHRGGHHRGPRGPALHGMAQRPAGGHLDSRSPWR